MLVVVRFCGGLPRSMGRSSAKLLGLVLLIKFVESLVRFCIGEALRGGGGVKFRAGLVWTELLVLKFSPGPTAG